MFYFFENYKKHAESVNFICIEQDSNAITFAETLCGNYLHKITFIRKNALRFTTEQKYDLIWSAGLFDYFDDKIFVFLLDRLRRMLKNDGELIIGNFCATNPSKAYMNLFKWHLQHRSPHSLRQLGIKAGFEKDRIRVGKEATGVNLFLHATL